MLRSIKLWSGKENANLQRRAVQVLSRQDCGAACIPKENSRPGGPHLKNIDRLTCKGKHPDAA
jgi:hypothetical protein